MNFKLEKKSGETANFSVILPGVCNATCPFCFWKRSSMESPMYIQQLTWYLKTLGNKITQVSITGGEPSLSPLLEKVVDTLRNFNEKKIVLTSNGTNILKYIEVFKDVIKHINISRHEIDDDKNKKIFNANDIPSKKDLTIICEKYNKIGIDVTLNKVVDKDYSDITDLENYIKFAKDVGASAISIRKNYNIDTLDNLPIEKILGLPAKKNSCPVCSTNIYILNGMPIYIKMSLKEPSDELNYIYEFIYHPNGELTEDWKGIKKITFIPVPIVEHNSKSKISDRFSNVGNSTCSHSNFSGRTSC